MIAQTKSIIIIYIISIVGLLGFGTVHADTFSFGLWGDMPYLRNGDGDRNGEKMIRLLESINTSKLAFTVFDGDSKDGSSLCLDNVIGKDTADLFNKVNVPTVYVLGDNEWTDCHRINNGSYNNLERLDYLRKTMFANEYSFGRTKMKLERQGVAGGRYSENSIWNYGGLVFVGLNVSGSNNNKVNAGKCIESESSRSESECEADNTEYLARDIANVSFLQYSFQLAKEQKTIGIVIIIHADPDFDELEDDREETAINGYNAFLMALIKETQEFKGRVLLVHGDTHSYKLDNPFEKLNTPLSNFTRLETFGSPNLHWVKVLVDTKSLDVFKFYPIFVSGNE